MSNNKTKYHSGKVMILADFFPIDLAKIIGEYCAVKHTVVIEYYGDLSSFTMYE